MGANLNLNKAKVPLLGWLLTVQIIISVGLLFSGEYDGVIALWIMIFLFLIPLYWAVHSRFIALRTICWISFLTQFITLPLFYFEPHNFMWAT